MRAKKPVGATPKRPSTPDGRRDKFRIIISGLLLGLAVGLWVFPFGGTDKPETKKLSEAVSFIKNDKVKSAKIFDGENRVELTLIKGEKPGKLSADFPVAYSDTLTEVLIDAEVPTKTEPYEPPSIFARFAVTLLPLILFIAVLVWLVRSGVLTGGIGKMSGKRGQQVGDVPETRFDDVAGADEAVAELRELVEFLNAGERFAKVGARAPRGALLCGPPGTGKTLLARAVAGEAGVPFFPLAGSDFVETYAGVGAKRVRELFDRARKADGAIIFIDEIDAVGRSRSDNAAGAADSERENTLISMLSEMDGFDSTHNIIVLAATNRPDILDAALTRPGRLDRQIQVPSPDRRGREAILAVHTRNRPLGDDVDLEQLARRTPGMSGADLEQLVNEACMEAGRKDRPAVDASCFDAAVATVAMGRARTSALVTEKDRLITAWHEAGHTLAAFLQPDNDDPVSVSIIPRGPAGGVTWMSGNDDIFLTRLQALSQLRTAMAGRAAEELLLDGEYTQGAHGDLQSATKLAWNMVTKYGMTEAGYLVIDDDTIRMGGPVVEQAHGHVQRLLSEAHTEATQLLTDNRELLQAVAEALLDQETLNLSDVTNIAAAHGVVR